MNDIQKDDFILPGNIGTVTMPNGTTREITKVVSTKGSHTITIGQLVQSYLDKKSNTEDADFEIIDNSNCVFDVKKIEDRLKELGALEDIDHEVVQPKLIENEKV